MPAMPTQPNLPFGEPEPTAPTRTETPPRPTPDRRRPLWARLLGKVLEAEGALEKRIDNYEDRKALVEERKAKLEIKWKAIEARYSRQFNALDGLLASLQSTSTYLTQQLANLPGPRKAGN